MDWLNETFPRSRLWLPLNEHIGAKEMSMSAMACPDDFTIDGDVFQILINAEEQYSLWPAAQSLPDGWTATGPVGAKSECLAYVDAHWTDMRPKSLRESMEAAARTR